MAAALLAVVLTACGGDDDEGARSACAESPGSKQGPIVIVAELEEVGEALALADCTPLYVNDVDDEKRIRCTGRCARIWVPLTVEKGDSVTSHTPVPISPLTFVKRPDGRRQAMIKERPLYTYSEESETAAAGDGITDNFGGTEFSWSVMTLADAAPRPGEAVGAAGAGPLGG